MITRTDLLLDGTLRDPTTGIGKPERGAQLVGVAG